MKPQKIVTGLGEILWDCYPNEKHLGGAPANVAIHAQRLGEKGIIVSAVGKDKLGDEIIEALEKEHIETTYIQKCSSHPTGTVDIHLDEKGNPHFHCSRDVAYDHMEWKDVYEKLANESDVVVVGTLAQRNKISFQTIQKFLKAAPSALKLFDVNIREWNKMTRWIVEETLASVDILKINEIELGHMVRAFWNEQKEAIHFLDWLVERYKLKFVVLSLGEKGSIITDGKERISCPGVKVNAVDTTGCGDGFIAGLIVKYLENRPLNEIGDFANCLGAFLATKKSATPAYSLDELEHFILTHRERTRVEMPLFR